ncbi:MAG: GNAT family N-acetyltransferase [Anaerolineae bacterium]|jgi:ribosomal protein S18 acetylase RimI-like enzyme|nr:GNAT family N-acetyltransferase [Anaerolineae bacterium]
MESTPIIMVERGIPDSQHRAAAEIYHQAFSQKLNILLGNQEQAIACIRDHLSPSHAFCGLREGQIVGLLGFHHNHQQLVNIGAGVLFKRFGFWGGLWRALWGSMLSRQPAKDELLLDGVAVDPKVRGGGIGTRLFDAVKIFAKQHAYDSIRLEVVNTNPRAQKLYERLGFTAEKTQSVPFMRRFGFTAVTTMRFRL